MGIKIQDITSKSAKIASTDLIEIAQVSGATYVSRKVTGSEINELSLDTTPQLGGNLDVNSNSIVSTSNGNITIEPNGTGDILLNADAVRIGDSNTDATIATRGTGDLILTTNQGAANQGVIRIYDGANGNIELTPNGTGSVIINIPINAQPVTTYTLALTDAGKMVEINSGLPATVTVPTSGSVDFPIGTQILISGLSGGVITIAAAVGVNILSSGNKKKLAAQYSIATLIKKATDDWYLAGDLTT